MVDALEPRYVVFFESAAPNLGWELRDQRIFRVIHYYNTAAEAQRHADALNMQPNGFHWRNGLFFRRGPEARVEIVRAGTDEASGELVASIPEPEWASIVCAVSASQETRERWDVAREFHGKPPSPTGESGEDK